MPNFPNFRLHDAQGSLCDTLVLVEVHDVHKAVNILTVSPNPARDFVQIGYISEQAGQLQIFDAVGQVVWSQVAEAGSRACQVELSGWPVGFYQ